MSSENSPTVIPAPTNPSTPVPFWETHAFGAFCGLLSAVAYLAANACLRSMTQHNAVWVSAIKAVPTVIILAPWLVMRAMRGERVAPPTYRALFALLCAGLIGQLGGNITFQQSLGIVGLALVVPLCMAGQIIGSAILGRIFLSESVTVRTAWAIGMLIAATAILSLGAQDAYKAVGAKIVTESPVQVLLFGVCGAVGAGFAYAALGVIIRRGLSADVSISTTLFVICLEGAILLGALGIYSAGPEEILAIASRDHTIMFLGGVFNFVAFLSLIKALQLTTVVYANALGSTQAAMAAFVGVAVFAEPLSPMMLVGVGLTVAGLVSMRGEKR